MIERENVGRDDGNGNRRSEPTARAGFSFIIYPAAAASTYFPLYAAGEAAPSTGLAL
jgi:hypothetical protein